MKDCRSTIPLSPFPNHALIVLHDPPRPTTSNREGAGPGKSFRRIAGQPRTDFVVSSARWEEARGELMYIHAGLLLTPCLVLEDQTPFRYFPLDSCSIVKHPTRMHNIIPLLPSHRTHTPCTTSRPALPVLYHACLTDWGFPLLSFSLLSSSSYLRPGSRRQRRKSSQVGL